MPRGDRSGLPAEAHNRLQWTALRVAAEPDRLRVKKKSRT
jgi:hypothetical protein